MVLVALAIVYLSDVFPNLFYCGSGYGNTCEDYGWTVIWWMNYPLMYLLALVTGVFFRSTWVVIGMSVILYHLLGAFIDSLLFRIRRK